MIVTKSTVKFAKELEPVVVDGKVVKLAKNAGEIFEPAAVEAARQMIFAPARKDETQK